MKQTADKILNLDEARNLVARWRDEGEKVVFTNGCFDIVHLGHIDYLEKARALGDRLVLGLDTAPDETATEASPQRLADKVAAYERGLIASALAAHGGSLKPVYEQLGVSRKTLYEKMQKYGLDKNLGSGLLQDDF